MQRILIVAFLFITSTAWTQVDVQQEYLRGKALFQQQNWTSAMQSFQRVAANTTNNPFAEYASFYFGVSALYAGRPEEAKAMFKQILVKYPSWNKKDEVYYWLARLYAGDQRWAEAFDQIDNIKNKAIATDAWKAMTSGMRRSTGVTELKLLNQRRPDNKQIAEVLAQKISQQPLMDQDQQLLSYLIKRHNLDEALLNVAELPNSEFKKTYRVAVMLPFMSENLKPEKNIRDLYFPLDLYEGIRLAVKNLAGEGVNIELSAYDTKKDSLTTLKLLNTTELKEADLVIGPLFPGPAQAAGEWALKNKVNIVNPLSVNPDYVKNNPFVYLYKPSLVTQANKAAEFSARTFESRNATIVYGDKERDSIMANAYFLKLKEFGFDNVKLLKLDKGEERAVRDNLTSDNEEDYEEGGRLAPGTIGHIFVASEDRLVVSSTLSALTGRKNKVPLVGLGSWIMSSKSGESLVSYNQAERLGAYLLFPEYIDYSSPKFFEFREMYLNNVHAMPSQFAYQGYDLMMYFGKMLQKHGTIFQKGLAVEPFTAGSLCTGFQYSDKQDNQCVPVIFFRDSALEIAYQ